MDIFVTIITFLVAAVFLVYYIFEIVQEKRRRKKGVTELHFARWFSVMFSAMALPFMVLGTVLYYTGLFMYGDYLLMQLIFTAFTVLPVYLARWRVYLIADKLEVYKLLGKKQYKVTDVTELRCGLSDIKAYVGEKRIFTWNHKIHTVERFYFEKSGEGAGNDFLKALKHDRCKVTDKPGSARENG